MKKSGHAWATQWGANLAATPCRVGKVPKEEAGPRAGGETANRFVAEYFVEALPQEYEGIRPRARG
jgi:hypothetical protein